MYGVENVVGDMRWAGKSYWPGVLARTFGEQQRLLDFLKTLPGEFVDAVEFGCGYARMTPVLTMVAAEVHAYERDEELAGIAGAVAQGFTVSRVESLASVPYPGGEADLIMTYTVLQHIADGDCARVLSEIRRCLNAGGVLVMAEESEGAASADVFPRTPQRYAEMGKLKLIAQTPRYVENQRRSGTIAAYALA